MPTLRQIQRRIRSVQSTAKTTRALSLVAGSKMRRAQQMALAHRPYADALYSMLVDVLDDISTISEATDDEAGLNPLLNRREVKTAGLILITSDRGLAGGLNTNLFRAGGAFITANPDVKLVTVGRKGSDFFRRLRTPIIATFMNLGDYPAYDDVVPIAHLVADAYIKGEVDSVSIVYPRFVNTVIQRPEVLRLLPAEPPTDREAAPNVEYIYEPDAKTVLADLLPRYVEIQVYRAVLEMAASYQSAQMVAMRNATDAAQDLVSQLTLLRNKVRQEQITKELLDITGGVEALSK